jgi:hypothetical protein
MMSSTFPRVKYVGKPVQCGQAAREQPHPYKETRSAAYSVQLAP